MARKKKGLPENFDIEIGTGTLEPAHVPGYLDEVEEQEDRLATKEVTPQPPPPPAARREEEPAPAPVTTQRPPAPKPSRSRKPQTARSSFSRLDAGLSQEEDEQLRELLDLVSSQCRKRITRAELSRALLAAAYEARNHYAGGFTAHRTRWGAKLNKELEADLRDALMNAMYLRQQELNEE